MIELAIGTRFYYKGRLCEYEDRQDNTEICFKWVEEKEGQI